VRGRLLCVLAAAAAFGLWYGGAMWILYGHIVTALNSVTP